MHSDFFHTPLGVLQIVATDDSLLRIEFSDPSARTTQNAHPLIRETKNQLTHYFQNPQHHFDLPLADANTTFQNKIRAALLKIKPGKTISYGALAEKLKSSARAVGQACRVNHFPIIIPCHRVVARNHVGGYAGHLEGTVHDKKHWLLTHEGVL